MPIRHICANGFHALLTIVIGLPISLVILAVRIVQEERAMKDLFVGATRS
jgi:isoprenylcysteine carboxyl methyltransferase (ICMT) family protein YpbQ